MPGGDSVPIDTVLLKTASRCNIACSYCYVYQLGDQGWQRQPPAMSRSTIDAVISRLDELRQAQGRDFAVVLHGGEPLLLGEALLTRLLTGLRANLAVGCTLSVQTNGDASHRSVARSVLGRRGHGLGKSRWTAENQRRSACADSTRVGPSRLRSTASIAYNTTTPPSACFQGR